MLGLLCHTTSYGCVQRNIHEAVCEWGSIDVARAVMESAKMPAAARIMVGPVGQSSKIAMAIPAPTDNNEAKQASRTIRPIDRAQWAATAAGSVNSASTKISPTTLISKTTATAISTSNNRSSQATGNPRNRAKSRSSATATKGRQSATRTTATTASPIAINTSRSGPAVRIEPNRKLMRCTL